VVCDEHLLDKQNFPKPPYIDGTVTALHGPKGDTMTTTQMITVPRSGRTIDPRNLTKADLRLKCVQKWLREQHIDADQDLEMVRAAAKAKMAIDQDLERVRVGVVSRLEETGDNPALDDMITADARSADRAREIREHKAAKRRAARERAERKAAQAEAEAAQADPKAMEYPCSKQGCDRSGPANRMRVVTASLTGTPEVICDRCAERRETVALAEVIAMAEKAARERAERKAKRRAARARREQAEAERREQAKAAFQARRTAYEADEEIVARVTDIVAGRADEIESVDRKTGEMGQAARGERPQPHRKVLGATLRSCAVTGDKFEKGVRPHFELIAVNGKQVWVAVRRELGRLVGRTAYEARQAYRAERKAALEQRAKRVEDRKARREAALEAALDGVTPDYVREPLNVDQVEDETADLSSCHICGEGIKENPKLQNRDGRVVCLCNRCSAGFFDAFKAFEKELEAELKDGMDDSAEAELARLRIRGGFRSDLDALLSQDDERRRQFGAIKRQLLSSRFDACGKIIDFCRKDLEWQERRRKRAEQRERREQTEGPRRRQSLDPQAVAAGQVNPDRKPGGGKKRTRAEIRAAKGDKSQPEQRPSKPKKGKGKGDQGKGDNKKKSSAPKKNGWGPGHPVAQRLSKQMGGEGDWSPTRIAKDFSLDGAKDLLTKLGH
jgi:hypothetical protein